MSFFTTNGVFSGAVATSGTFTLGYPTGSRLGSFNAGKTHRLIVGGKVYSSPNDFTVAFTSATVITVTWLATNTLPAGAAWRLQLDVGGPDNANPFAVNNFGFEAAGITRAQLTYNLRLNLGAPITASATGVTTAQTLGAAGDLTLDGTRVTSGVAVLDVPRNVTLTVATTNHSGKTFTVYGTDEYGATLIEQITGPNNNTVQGKKAFKTVTRVAVSAALATDGVSVGFGDVLGLPVYIPHAGVVVAEFEGLTKPTAGTTVGGLSPYTKSTATTADVRGTYDPNSACDGAKVFELEVQVTDPVFKGVPQYAG